MPSYRLFVGNLPWTIGKTQLKEYFSQFGRVKNSVVSFDKATGFSKGFGFIMFHSQEAFLAALSHNQHILEGRRLSTGPADKDEILKR